jgi:endonuclease/exonuclease/phosphatase family metal-dependent hydrolase
MVTRRIKLLTYNIHSGFGVDGRYDLGRIRQILEDEKPDISALQELDCNTARSSGEDQSKELAGALSTNAFFCSTRRIENGSFGMAVLSPFPIIRRKQYDLSYQTHREPRICIRTDLRIDEHAVLHVFNCHLGLALRERKFQRQQLLSDAILLSEDLHHPVILMGDFNDRPISVVHRNLRRHFRDAYNAVGKFWGPTFKVGPIPIRLDHIYLSPAIRVLDCRVRTDALARVASDHRPLIATVEVTWPGVTTRKAS